MFWLLACACPTFEETEVYDASSEGAPPGVLGEVRDALRDFATWSGAAGVCVTEIRIEDGVERPDGEEMGGRYNPVARDIVIDKDYWPMREAVIHELCHAYDRGFSAEAPELFPIDEVEQDAAYPNESVRLREAFARACETMYGDRSIDLALADQCGGTDATEQDRFMAETVFPGAQYALGGGAAVSLGRTIVTALGRYDDVQAAAGAGDEVVLLVQETRWKAIGDPLWLVFVDPDTGVESRRTRVDLPVIDWYGTFFQADDGAPLLLLQARDWAPRAFRVVDGALVPATAPPGYYLWFSEGVIADGVAVYSAPFETTMPSGGALLVGAVRATRLATGEDVPLAFPMDEWDRSVWPEGLGIGPEGVEMLSLEGHARLDAGAGTWTLAPAPLDLYGLLFVGGQRVSFTRTDVGLAPVVEVAGTWTLADGACGEDVSAHDSVPVQVGARGFLVSAEGGQVSITEVLLP